ncbi:hypothetical protein G9F72_010075 [Clostridium estertheticum]|nr:hypothetical protein [Clostridium estertheticum]MBZ9686672.1 hypothetical protein [Clostridium estertheticum]
MNKKSLRNMFCCIILVVAVAVFGIISTMNTEDPDSKGFNVTSVHNV